MEINIRKNHLNPLSAILLIGIYAVTVFLISVPVYAKEAILVIRTEGKDFEQAAKGMRQETEEDFSMTEMLVTRSTAAGELAGKIKENSPDIVVLMDNISISLYKKYQAELPASVSPLPCVALMASFMDIALKGIKNAAGIFYEVPSVTGVVNLRAIMPGVRFRKVGVLFRDFMAESVKTNQVFCEKEQITLTAYPIPSRGDIASEIKEGLEFLNRKEKIDALWILNDSAMINAELLREVWLPFAAEFEKPIIAGVEVLVQPRFRFGTFAVIPDPMELGAQAADMIYNIRKNNWKVNDNEIKQPRSVYKIINMEQAQRLFRIDREQLNNVDKVLE